MTRRTITVRATGRSETIPELTTVEVTASGGGESAAVARERARDRAATIRTTLPVDDDRIRTTDRRVEPTSDLVGKFPSDEYCAALTLHVDCVAGTAAAVVVDATDVGGEIESVEFGLHEETTRRLEDEALDAAMARAGTKAERIAAAEGLTVGEVVSVTTVAEETGAEPSSFVDEGMELATEADFEPDPVVVSEAVEVTYELDG